MRSSRTARPTGSPRPTSRWRSATPTAGSSSSTMPAIPRRTASPVRATHPRQPCAQSKNSPTTRRAVAERDRRRSARACRELYESAIAAPQTASRRGRDSRAAHLARRRLQASRRHRTELRERPGRRLALASDHYRQAHLLRLQRQGLDPYPALNWLTLAALLDEQVPDADALVERCEATARERVLDRPQVLHGDRHRRRCVGACAQIGPARAGWPGGGRRGRPGSRARFQEVVNDLAAPTASELDSVVQCRSTSLRRLLQKIAPKRASTRATVAGSTSYAGGSWAWNATIRKPARPSTRVAITHAQTGQRRPSG